ncbi:hypothetical protein LCGC14_0422830 [marine sediment metagenome]|uniref:Phosphohydrolase n=1 Tax=marine sediment metagenome TaxID=412755 RepID=A0A0F9SQD2_9ZZZZ
MNTKIVTYTGKSFDLLNPSPDMVCIEDIAHSLANMCRYTGHVRQFYSVAQHCVLTAMADLPGDSLKRLLHDAGEAYVGDIASPWKQLLQVDVPETVSVNQHYVPVHEWESKIQKIIGTALGIDLSYSAEVKIADDHMYFTEIRDLMPLSEEFRRWRGNLKPLNNRIECWNPSVAEKTFLFIYNKLKGERIV